MNDIQKAAQRLLSRGEISGDDYSRLEKTGAFRLGNLGRQIAETAREMAPIGMLASLGIGGVALGKEVFVDPMLEKNKMERSFNMVPVKVPQLQSVNKDSLRDYFDVIQTYSPRAAANPIVAGALIQKMHEFNGLVDHKIVQDLTEIERSKGDSGKGGGAKSLISDSFKSLSGLKMDALDPNASFMASMPWY